MEESKESKASEPPEPSLVVRLKTWNIGLVGHVSNGKTTLVQRLTNIDTKRNSKEKKRNCTIQLGYANAVLWECVDCKYVTSTNQTHKKSICKKCKALQLPRYLVSFVDVPGHHSYVSTMIKGTSVMDAAILVTDARQKELQAQTMEHLAILQVLGVQDILVLQNKVDLGGKEVCLDHYKMLQTELEGTPAYKKPIIPISAFKKWNMDIVSEQLLQLCRQLDQKSVNVPTSPCFAIVRTFDINKPSCAIDNLRGGVLGGTVIGSETHFHVGERIEVRPGLCLADGSCRPLETEILSIYAECEPVEEISRGGLFALGTKLDPTLTRSDRLSGSLAGRPQDLPPVITEADMAVTRIKLPNNGEKVPKIKKDHVYLFVLNHLVIRGRIISKKKSLYRVHFLQPICTQASKCLIYNTGSDTQMLGFGTLR